MNSSPEAIERKKATGFGEHHQEAVDLAWSRFDFWFKKYLQVSKWNQSLKKCATWQCWERVQSNVKIMSSEKVVLPDVI